MKRICTIIIAAVFAQTALAEKERLTLYFGYDKHELNLKETAKLQKTINGLNGYYPNYTINIYGHTDADGSWEYNRGLSKRRSNDVKDYLVSTGFQSDNIKYKAWGEDHPVASNQDDQGKQMNRRVTVEFKVDDEAPFNGFNFGPAKQVERRFANKEIVLKASQSSSTVKIPANSIVDKNGRIVRGQVDVVLKEYRTQADFITSGIPMTFDYGDQIYSFNSTGMFDLRVYQNGNELDLKPGATIDITFVQTDTIPNVNLYFFDDKTRKWEAMNNTMDKIIQNDLGGQTVNVAEIWTGGGRRFDFRCVSPFSLANNSDTLSALIAAIEEGNRIAELINPDNFTAASLGIPLFEDRFNDLNFAGTHPIILKNGERNPRVKNNIRLEQTREFTYLLRANKTGFKIRNLQGSNKELVKLRSVIWELDEANTDLDKDELFANSWSDIRIEYADDQDNFLITLKNEDGFTTVVAKGRYTRKNSGTIGRSRLLKRRHSSYLSTLKLRECRFNMDFDPLVRELKDQYLDSLKEEISSSFYYYSKLFMEGSEYCMLEDQWKEYILEQPKMLLKRYGDLKEIDFVANDSGIALVREYMTDLRSRYEADPMENQKLEYKEDSNLLSDIFVGLEYRPLGVQWWKWYNGLEVKNIWVGLDNMDVAVGGGWTGNFLPPSSADPGHTYPELIRDLSVSGFGVYNCDQVRQLGKTLTVSASYKDQDGNRIKPHVLSMIDLNINGAMSFDPRFFSYNPDRRNVLLLFAKDGKKYLYSEEQMAKLDLYNNAQHTFVVEDVTDSIQSLDDLNRILGRN